MLLSRRAFVGRSAASLAALSLSPSLLRAAMSQADASISHTADAIHQEGLIKASPARVYAASPEGQTVRWRGQAQRGDEESAAQRTTLRNQ